MAKGTSVKQFLFSLLAKVNQLLLPRYSQRNLTRLSGFDKMIVAYRYWVTKNALK